MVLDYNSEINRKNRQNNVGFNGGYKYCLLCGKPIIYTQNDKNGNPNHNRDKEWNESVCHECWPKFIKNKFTNKN